MSSGLGGLGGYGGLGAMGYRGQQSLGVPPDPLNGRLSPFPEVHAGFENPRALFVRPSEIVYVVGAE